MFTRLLVAGAEDLLETSLAIPRGRGGEDPLGPQSLFLSLIVSGGMPERRMEWDGVSVRPGQH